MPDIHIYFKMKGHPNIPNKVLQYQLNCLGLVTLLPHNKQPFVTYNQGPTVSSLCSSILVESIFHVDVVR